MQDTPSTEQSHSDQVDSVEFGGLALVVVSILGGVVLAVSGCIQRASEEANAQRALNQAWLGATCREQFAEKAGLKSTADITVQHGVHYDANAGLCRARPHDQKILEWKPR